MAGAAVALLLPLSTYAGAAAPRFTAETLTPGPERYVVRTAPSGAVTIRAKVPRATGCRWT